MGSPLCPRTGDAAAPELVMPWSPEGLSPQPCSWHKKLSVCSHLAAFYGAKHFKSEGTQGPTPAVVLCLLGCEKGNGGKDLLEEKRN